MSDDRVAAILGGDVRSAGRLMRELDDRVPAGYVALKALFPHTGRAYMVGITGNPGAGKSTLVDALIAYYRAAGERVGVVCVDPTSPFTGGAILGDRVRMQRHALDPGVFIHSVATRGHLGGLSRSAFDIAHVFDAMGFDRVLIETVGVGQDEIDVMRVAHTTIVVSVPGLGDDIQAIKSGLLEIADVLVVNKADRAGADRTERDLVHMVAMRDGAGGRPAVSVLRTIATRGMAEGSGVTDLATAIDVHRAAAWTGPGAQERALARTSAHVGELVRGALADRAAAALAARGREIADAVNARRTDPWTLAEQLVDGV